MKQGGKRAGAGRPVGTGKFKAPTKIIRIPKNMEEQIFKFISGGQQSVRYFSTTVQAGYATALAEDVAAENVNLHSYLIDKDEDTFLVNASGESMVDAGIFDGDMLIVKANAKPRDGDIVVAEVNGEFTVKRLYYQKGLPVLQPENPDFKPIKLRFNDELKIHGVVSYCVHRV